MSHSLHTTPHMEMRYWVAFAFAAVVVLASVVWVVMIVSERLTFGGDWDQGQIAPRSSNSVPAAEYPWLDPIQPTKPMGIADLPGRLGDK